MLNKPSQSIITYSTYLSFSYNIDILIHNPSVHLPESTLNLVPNILFKI